MDSLRSLGRRLVSFALLVEGSTRALALMRIGTVLLLWARFADRFVVYRDSSAGDLALSAAFYASTLALALGFCTPVASAATAAVMLYCYYYLGVVLGDGGWTHHHMQLLVLTTALLPLTPCGRSYSLDRLWALARALSAARPAPAESGPLWGLRLLSLLMSSVYLSTFFNKTGAAFLSGERLQAIFAGHYTGSDFVDGPLVDALMMAAAVSAWALEGLLVFGLFIPRLRLPLMFAGSAMHLSFHVLFRIYTFTANVVMLYFAYLPQAKIHDTIDRLCGASAAPEVAPVQRTVSSPRLAARLLAIALCLGGAGWLARSALRTVASPPGVAAPGVPSPARAHPQLLLLEGRFATFLAERKAAARVRGVQAGREAQKWGPRR